MKVGDYVRTPLGITKYLGNYKMFDGSIAKNLHEFDKLDESLWSGDLYGIVFDCDLEDIVLKSSPNIIDLIEVGDFITYKKGNMYINIPYRVYGTYNEILEETELRIDDEYLKDIEILSIVTHEQFERMQYNLESEVN